MHSRDNLAFFDPNVLGATGGSGTRVFARIVRHGGMFIGDNLNVSEDSLDLAEYLDRWIDEFMPFWDAPEEAHAHSEMIRELKLTLAKHCGSFDSTASQPWGWKEPRSIYLLPLFHSYLPSMKFLHVIRDGRDMAYSTNQNQLRKHGHTLLRITDNFSSQPLQSIALWSRINLLAADYGERRMPGQYLRVQFEDLCREPATVTARILEFFELQGNAEQIAWLTVVPPDSIGRWREAGAETLAELQQIGQVALARFGYL